MTLSLFHLHGELKDTPFPRLLAALRTDRFTGVLQANCRAAAADGSSTPKQNDAGPAEAGITREIHFAEGHIAWAISTDPEESLKSYLLRHGAVTPQQWVTAESQAAGGTLRQSLVDSGAIAARELSRKEKGRIEEIVLALFPIRDGEYRVRERQLPPGTPDLKVDPDPLLLRGMMGSADYAFVMEEIGSLDAVPVLANGARSEPDPSLPGEFHAILKHIDGRNSVGAICAATGLPDNYVCTMVAALNLVGAVRRQPAGRPRAESRAPEARDARVTPPIVASRIAAPPPVLPMMEVPPDPSPMPVREAPQASARELPPIRPRAEVEAPPQTAQDEVPAATLEEDSLEDDPIPDESVEDEFIDEESAEEGAIGAVPGAALPSSGPAPASIYGEAAAHDRSRPWFLLGGAAAVGFAALFLILMSHDGGTAQELPARPAAATPIDRPTVPEEPDTTDEADSDLRTTAPSPDPGPARVMPPAPTVASAASAPILASGASGDPSGRRRLESGDFAGAARSFSRELAPASNAYTIQLLAACKEETVQRAIRSARGASQIFLLPAKVGGQDCYRVLWGRYASQRLAEEALRSDVPSAFRQDRNKPRVTRLRG